MRRPLLCVLVGLALLTGCSSGGDDADAASGTTTTATATTTASAPASTSPAATGSAPAGCPATGDALTGTAHAPTLDVDGDGRPDTEWIATQPAADGSTRFGVQTASGDAIAADFPSASPVARSLLVADVTGHGELVALVSDGRQVALYAISDCSIVPVQNAQGEQYAFDLGFTGYGTGVGCADVGGDGVRDLVGLQADGTSITSTAVELDGPRATNGPSTTTTGATAAQLDLAHQVTCGDLTLAADGVTSGP
ncbi:hypothetical protein [Modestobacter italicus]|uniref:hypothetical protein n=1 Tax=Modestobacter italicus (strain DSM 44449 / CECT 9708 / BC 501) TaxID=2732864 RepID=UPI00141375CE|nr:hypothetical protein [Modestobacter marinus]